MRVKQYNRGEVIKYAEKWAMRRNPKYYNFDPVGGDCTSFASQSIYAGTGIMNYNKYGWYYRSGYDKSPSWSGVEYLYNFLVNNKGIGPFGRKIEIGEIEKGDVIQLSFDGNIYHHSLLVVDIPNNIKTLSNIRIATHTEDAYNRKLSTYTYDEIRFIKIDGVRIY